MYEHHLLFDFALLHQFEAFLEKGNQDSKDPCTNNQFIADVHDILELVRDCAGLQAKLQLATDVILDTHVLH